MKKTQQGITLIALIITIIVLLILALVSIREILGNGIIEYAKTAKEKHNIEELKESVNLVLSDRKMSKETPNYTASLKEELEKIKGAQIEEIRTDTCYVIKDDITLTVYEDGDILESKVDVWDGTTSEVPEIKEFNWYIYNTAQLKFFADYVNNGRELLEEQKTLVENAGYSESNITITEETIVHLMNNLDLGARQTNGTLTSGVEWIPIGTTNDLKFIGTFDGNNNIIKGVYVNKETSGAGLFGNAYTIQNLTIKDSYIKSSSSLVGGIVGALRKGSVINCHNINTEVIGLYTVGGIVGQSSTGTDIIKDCTNSGSVSAPKENNKGCSRVGGIAGYAANNGIKNCKNSGKVYGLLNITGGIVAIANNIQALENCTNIGTVISEEGVVGGITGVLGGTINVENCVNQGDVVGTLDCTAGIIGSTNASAIINVSSCINTTSVTAKEKTSFVAYTGARGLGGIIGKHGKLTTINNCKNLGNITDENRDSFTGGISGLVFGNINNSYNLGIVKGSNKLGGIAGVKKETGQLQGCYNRGNIISESNNATEIGGIVGGTANGISGGTIICNNYTTGEIKINSEKATNVGGIIGYLVEEITTSNNYYLSGRTNVTLNSTGEAKTEAEMKTEEFVTLLNAGLDIVAWELRGGANDGYPVIIGLE